MTRILSENSKHRLAAWSMLHPAHVECSFQAYDDFVALAVSSHGSLYGQVLLCSSHDPSALKHQELLGVPFLADLLDLDVMSQLVRKT